MGSHWKLKRFHLGNAVLQVVGGCPAKYLILQGLIAECSDDAVVDTTKNHLVSVLSEASQLSVLKCSPNTEAIVFRERKELQLSVYELKGLGLMLDYLNKVFREVTRLDGIFIKPATSAVGLILTERSCTGQDVVSLANRL
ncbi:hypothetical protein EON65_54645 [archaeon]|nr:MAG: hypothetical protein EON65_54645 [archaeon]